MNIIEFYFDLGSPYSFLAFHRLKHIAETLNAQIIYKPMLLGGVFKATGNTSPIMVPAKAKYSMIDMQRWAKLWNIPMKMNPNFPINTLPLMRLITAIQLFAPEKFDESLEHLFEAMFRKPRNLNDQNEIMAVLSQVGFDLDKTKTWLHDQKVKSELKFVTDQAIERGIFGAPTFFVKDEMFWGVDHLHFVESALKNHDK